MTWKTHVIGGAQAGLVLAYAAGGTIEESALIASCAVLGSVLPDIDYPKSMLAKSDLFMGLISRIVSGFTVHRGFTHTVPGAAAFALLFYALAMFRTERESLFAFFAALTLFLTVHAVGKGLSALAGWLAVAAYVLGPRLAQIAAGRDFTVSLDRRSALLCAAGVFAGCIMHMLYDTANVGGVRWLYPFSKKRFRAASVKTNSPSEIRFAGVQIFVLGLVIAVCIHGTGAETILNDISALLRK